MATPLHQLPVVPLPPASPVAVRFTERFVPSLSYPLCVVGVYTAPFERLVLFGKYPIAYLLLGAAGALLVPGLLAGRTRVWMPWWLAASALLLWLALMIRTAWPGLGEGDLVGTGYAAIVSIMVPMLIASQRTTSAEQVLILVYAWTLGSLTCAVVAMLQHQGIELPLLGNYLNRLGSRVAGLNVHPNTLGFYVALAVPLQLSIALTRRSTPGFAFWLGAAGISLYTIDLTGSRTALVAAVLTSALVTVMHAVFLRRSEAGTRALRLFFLGAGALIVLQFIGVGSETAFGRLFLDADSASLADEGRTLAQRDSWAAFWEYPFAGNGYQHFGEAHNLWLSALQSGGVLGLAALLLRDAGIGVYLLRLLRGPVVARRHYDLLVGLTGAYVVWLLDGIKEGYLLHRHSAIALGLIGLLLVYEHNRGSRRG